MNKTKEEQRARRKMHIRKVVVGTPERPRLCVFRSLTHIYAQIIDDETGTTLASASSLKMEFPDGASGGNKDGAKLVGQAVAAAAAQKSIQRVVFDRNGYLYHGRIAALADGAREGGLEF